MMCCVISPVIAVKPPSINMPPMSCRILGSTSFQVANRPNPVNIEITPVVAR